MTMNADVPLYIGGSWRRTAETLPIINPATEDVIGTVAVAGRQDLEDALAAAAEGFRTWSRTSSWKRSEIILKASALMQIGRASCRERVCMLV